MVFVKNNSGKGISDFFKSISSSAYKAKENVVDFFSGFAHPKAATESVKALREQLTQDISTIQRLIKMYNNGMQLSDIANSDQ